MEFSRWKNFFVILFMMTILTIGAYFALQNKDNFNNHPKALGDQSNISNTAVAVVNTSIPLSQPLPQKLSNPPEIIKAIYVTGYSAGSKKYLDYLSYLFKNTEINAVVVDIKDYSGLLSYSSDISDAKKYNLYNGAIRNIDTLINFLHSQNIYVIGRIVVFEDPAFSKARPNLAIYDKSKTADLSQPILWQDNHGLSWLDPASKDAWDYNISLAKDAFLHGFDEMNFDYVRFPSDGKTENMGFPIWDGKVPKSETIKEFFNYTRWELPNEKISIDLFGETTVDTNDIGIGQIIENAFENFNYISPMVYPSHYADEFIGFVNPAEHPYEVIKYSMDSALNREKIFLKQKQDLVVKNGEITGSSSALLRVLTPVIISVNLAKFRPWLQDFNMGADYNAQMVKDEIKATQDSLGNNFSGFMLWNPSNIYTIDAIRK